ncbi:hypothetical protein [Haloarcula amylovorans]|uniref:hypothetical protein n=1 Tax=Haloarcula amylovorans TaxID=2562280 RepID=UPI001075E52E|nr:hypothetical protein [Halomicroarcula amylolytica]
MNRRQFLAGLGGAAAVGGGYAGVRLADLRPYDPELPSGETPRERIIAAARHRYVADHRAVTRVRMTRDSAGDSGYDAARYRQHHEHSRREHTHVFTTRRRPAGRVPHPFPGLLGLFHWNGVGRGELPATSVIHLTDGAIRTSWDAPTPDGVSARPKFGDDGTYATHSPRSSGMFGEFVRPHRTAWRETDDGTYEVSTRDGYAQVVTLARGIERLHGDCRVVVSLDDAGRLARVVDDRTMTLADAERGRGGDERAERTVGYRVVTEFDRYGTATAPRPAGELNPDTRTHLASAFYDLRRY